VLQEGLTITQPVKVRLQLELAREAGGIQGIVHDEEGSGPGGAVVVLAAAARMRFRRDLFQETTMDQKRSCRLRGIPPGEYTLFAWREAEPGIWFDAEFMKNFDGSAKAVTVTAKSEQTADLRALTTGK
jgi:hypothetical protein